MTQPAKFSCPHCNNLFTISDPSHYGKQIRCPTCSGVLIIPAPKTPAPAPVANPAPVPQNTLQNTPAQTPFPADSQIWDSQIPSQPASGFPPAPTQPSGVPAFNTRPPGPPKKKKKGGKKTGKKKRSLVAPLIVAGAIIGILVPAGVLSFMFLGGSSDGNVVDMTWLPQDSESLVHINVQRIVSSDLFKNEVANTPQFRNGLEKLQKEMGFALDDVKSVTLGVPKNERDKVGVIRLSRKFDQIKFPEHAVTEELNGYEIYTKNREAFMAPDLRTIVIGTPEALKAAAKRGPAKVRRPEFDFADSSQDVFVCIAPNDKGDIAKHAGLSPMMGPPRAATKAAATFKAKGQGVAYGVSYSGENLDVKMQVDMIDKAASSELLTGLNEAITEGKSQFEQIGGILPADFKSLADKVIASVLIDDVGGEVDVTLQLPLAEMIKQAKSSGFPMPGANPFDRPSSSSNMPDFSDIFN